MALTFKLIKGSLGERGGGGRVGGITFLFRPHPCVDECDLADQRPQDLTNLPPERALAKNIFYQFWYYT